MIFMPQLLYAQFEIGVNGGICISGETVYQSTLSVKFLKHFKAGAGYELNNVYNGNNTPFLFADYYRESGKVEVYAGVSGGIVSATAQDNTESSGSGYVYGVQLGATYEIYKNICINAQVDAKYADVSFDYTHFLCGQGTLTSSFFYFPLTIGIHYKLPNLIKHKAK